MGISEMWLIDHEKQEVELRSFEEGQDNVYKTDETLHSLVLKKIKIPIADFFD